MITVLTTGGTIASVPHPSGGVVATLTGPELLGDAPAVEVEEISRIGSYAMTVEELERIARTAVARASDPRVTGVVITHGTDTLEEGAFLCALLHDGATPIVFTGAQLHAGRPQADGPRNLRDAQAVAGDAGARGRGVLVCLGGRVDAGAVAVKRSTVDPAPFADPHMPPQALVNHGCVRWVAPPVRAPVKLTPERLEPRVEVVALSIGAGPRMLEAAAADGARGIVLQAMGLGNAPPAIAATVRELVAAGVVVTVTSRCDTGPVAAVYGNGGGHDLHTAGALFAGRLRTSQARVLMMSALGSGNGRDEIAELLKHWAIDTPPR